MKIVTDRSEIVDAKTFSDHFSVSRETLERLEVFEEALRRWQRAINLVAPATLPAIWQRHFADSAQLAALIPPTAKTVVDLGSGAGFPGMVLAILLGPIDCEQNVDPPRLTRISLVESDGRKSAFLRDVARLTGTAVDILSTRVENHVTQGRIGKVDVVTARAFAPMDRLLELALPYFAEGTTGLFLKGRGVEAEVSAARQRFEFDISLVPSVTCADASVAVIRCPKVDLAPTGRGES